MKKLFVGGLSADSTEDSLKSLFSEYGTVRSINFSRDIFTGRCRGFAFIEMEGHEARAAISGLHGKLVNEKPLTVKFEDVSRGRGRRR